MENKQRSEMSAKKMGDYIIECEYDHALGLEVRVIEKEPGKPWAKDGAAAFSKFYPNLNPREKISATKEAWKEFREQGE